MLFFCVHECLHEFMESKQAVAARHARHFVILLHLVGLYTFIIYKEGHWLSYMDTHLNRRQVVGQDGDGHRFFPGRYLTIDGSNKPLVQILYSLQSRSPSWPASSLAST